jgi:hypothetical protein
MLISRYAALVLVGGLLAGCAGGAGFDPISSDQPGDNAGISTAQFEGGETCPDEVEFNFGRNAEAESMTFDCTQADGTGWSVAYSISASENTKTHTARAALAEAMSGDIADATPGAIDGISAIVQALFPAGVP